MLWFDLALTDFYAAWKGKLIMSWPPPERAWWRRAHRNELSVLALLEESALDATMPEWDELALTWEDLRVLPTRWKSALSQWRGIYVIFDHDDRKSYVGSAYGKTTSSDDGCTTRPLGMVETSISGSAIPGVSPSRSSSASHRHGSGTRSFGLKRRGSSSPYASPRRLNDN